MKCTICAAAASWRTSQARMDAGEPLILYCDGCVVPNHAGVEKLDPERQLAEDRQAFGKLMKEPEPQRYVLVCTSCQGINVQAMDWLDANTNRFIGGNDDPNFGDTFCEDCDQNHKLTSVPWTEELGKKLEERERKLKEDGCG